jgi:hypothetical protein
MAPKRTFEAMEDNRSEHQLIEERILCERVSSPSPVPQSAYVNIVATEEFSLNSATDFAKVFASGSLLIGKQITRTIACAVKNNHKAVRRCTIRYGKNLVCKLHRAASVKMEGLKRLCIELLFTPARNSARARFPEEPVAVTHNYDPLTAISEPIIEQVSQDDNSDTESIKSEDWEDSPAIHLFASDTPKKTEPQAIETQLEAAEEGINRLLLTEDDTSTLRLRTSTRRQEQRIEERKLEEE